jgi:hypothetical protein
VIKLRRVGWAGHFERTSKQEIHTSGLKILIGRHTGVDERITLKWKEKEILDI